MSGFMKSAKKALLLAVLAVPLLQNAQAAEQITIDARRTDNTVDRHMFGANYVFTWNTLTQLDKANNYVRLHTVRFPGGSVTESNFNPVDPNRYMDGKRVSSDKRIGKFIGMVNKYNWKPAFVVPTARYVNDLGRGEREIEEYVRRLLRGDFGRIENGRTVHFEVGNEFYWRSDINADEYGRVAARLVSAIHAGIRRSGASGRYQTEVSVQSGNKTSDARVVARHLRNHRALVDYLTYHWYPGRAEIQLGYWRMDKTTQTFDARLESIAREWDRHARYRKPFFLSEYNIVSNKSRGADHGLRNPLGIMSIFAGAVRADTRMATIWPLVAWKENLPTKLFRSHSSSTAVPTTNGIFYRWMRDTLPDSRIIDGIGNSSYSNRHNFRQGIYTEAFRKGSDTLIVYAFGMEAGTEQVTLNFRNFTASSVRADKLYTTSGQEANERVVAREGRLWPKLWSGNRKATFTINKNSRYEVVKLVFKGRFH